MTAGRIPTPDPLRLIQGCRDKKAQDQKAPSAPPLEHDTCPDYLTGYAKECWDNLAPRLVQKGWLSALDQPLFEMFCQCYAEYRIAIDALAEPVGQNDPAGGRTYWSYGRYGKMQRTKPQVAQMHEAIRQLKGIAAEFGLSPAARVRLRGTDQIDFFDDLDEALRK